MSDKLFSEDYLNSLNPEEAGVTGPVSVFGLIFKNEEDRRQYFRDELRKKLPELRHIEGFPVGDDDDIINLSDPPYYTACPNPWLNDFVNMWEEEKKGLKIKGLRRENKIVKEPYASDVSEGKSNPIYNAHTYHTKVPHPAIMRYILHYTQPGDIIFDGFCGTGMTGVATSLCDSNEVLTLAEKHATIGERHCICSDLSPIASLIAKVYNTDHSHDMFERKASKILEDVKQECMWMYKTQDEYGNDGIIKNVIWTDVFVCSNCGGDIEYLSCKEGKNSLRCPNCNSLFAKKDLVRKESTEYDNIVNDVVSMPRMKPVLIEYTVNGRQMTKKPSSFDLELIKKIDSIEIPYWIPIEELKMGFNTQQPIKANGIKRIYQFYSKRNLYILSSIYDKVKRDHSLLLWFTSQLINISKLNRYRPEVSFPYNPLNGTLYIGSQICEANIFDAYKNKLNKFSKAFSLLSQNNVVNVCSATDLQIANESVDYIFVDPPFGANIMYSDLNSLWEGWIKVKTESTDEAIMNPFQNKELFDYESLMNRSFKEFYRILKPNKWLTMEFSNTSASVWNSIQNALQGVGFVVANVAALDKQLGSFKSVTSTTAVKQDLIITCYKPSKELSRKLDDSFDTSKNVWDFIDEYLIHLPVHVERNHATTSVIERSPKILFDRLISYYVQHGYPVPMDAQTFQAGLREHYIERDGMFFTASQAAEYEEKKIKAPDFVPMGIIISDEANGIEWLKNELRDNPQTYQDLQPKWMKALNGVRKGDKLPGLDEILGENFIQNENGTWRMANINDDVDLEKLRTKALLKEFKLYLEVASKPRGKLKDVRVEAVRAGFKQCYSEKNFANIVLVGDRIPQNLLTEDEILLQYYDIASSRV